MAKQLSSLDLHFLLKELKHLEGSKVDKIYNLGNEEICIQIFKSNSGKKILRIINSKSLFLTDVKSSEGKPSEFCMLLRKKLENKFLLNMEQLEPERIIKITLKGKDEEIRLYAEFFGRGNIILCNKDDIIIDSLIRHKFRERAITPKEKYKWPVMQYNLFGIGKNELSSLLKNSDRDKIITALATGLGLGGLYSEEICLLSKIDKNISPKSISENHIKLILASIRKILKNKANASIVYDNGQAIDVVPFDLEFYKNHDKKEFSSFGEALNYYFTKEIKLSKKESKYEKQISGLKRIMEEQEASIKILIAEEQEFREKAGVIYSQYSLIKEILNEVNKAREKHSWEEIKKRLKGHKIVKEVNAKDKTIAIEL